MAQIISKILDAMLANVKLSLVASAANIWKTTGESPGSPPADLKLIYFSCQKPKMKKIKPWEF